MLKPPFDFRDVKPGEFAYFTKRNLQNKEKEDTGMIYVWKRKDDTEHQFKLGCPYCQEESDGTIDLKRRPYRLRCPHCNRSITLKKLKDA